MALPPCYRIDMGTVVERAFLRFAAACIDMLQFIMTLLFVGTILNPFISACAMGFFWIFLHGNPRWKISGTILTLVLEASPLGFLPIWTIRVWWATGAPADDS